MPSILPSIIHPPAYPTAATTTSQTLSYNQLPPPNSLFTTSPPFLSLKNMVCNPCLFPFPDHPPPMMRCVNDEAARRLRHVLSVLSAPQGQQRTNVRDVLQPLEEGHQVHQVAVRRVANPALYGYGIVWHKISCCFYRTGGPTTHLDETCSSTGYYPES